MLDRVPQIWASTIMDALEKHLTIVDQFWREEQAQHEERMATDPDYAEAYELHRAEDETESYWDALYDNQRLEEDEWDE